MRFFFLTAIVAVASMISVTAGRTTCSPIDGNCTINSDCCGKNTFTPQPQGNMCVDQTPDPNPTPK